MSSAAPFQMPTLWTSVPADAFPAIFTSERLVLLEKVFTYLSHQTPSTSDFSLEVHTILSDLGSAIHAHHTEAIESSMAKLFVLFQVSRGINSSSRLTSLNVCVISRMWVMFVITLMLLMWHARLFSCMPVLSSKSTAPSTKTTWSAWRRKPGDRGDSHGVLSRNVHQSQVRIIYYISFL